MAITFTHTFEINAGDLAFGGELEFETGTYTENQPEELPANLEVDFKHIIEDLKKFANTYGSLEKFEVKPKE